MRSEHFIIAVVAPQMHDVRIVEGVRLTVPVSEFDDQRSLPVVHRLRVHARDRIQSAGHSVFISYHQGKGIVVQEQLRGHLLLELLRGHDRIRILQQHRDADSRIDLQSVLRILPDMFCHQLPNSLHIRPHARPDHIGLIQPAIPGIIVFPPGRDHRDLAAFIRLCDSRVLLQRGFPPTETIKKSHTHLTKSHSGNHSCCPDILHMRPAAPLFRRFFWLGRWS